MVPGSGSWPLVDAATMRALDRHTIDSWGVPGDVLMESAGRACAAAVLERLAPSLRRVTVFCGVGNNGGDGLVIARHLHLAGVDVAARIVGDASLLQGESFSNYARARAVGVVFDSFDAPIPESGWVVDALLGTGLTRPIAGDAARTIERIASAAERGARVFAVDLPSGLDADTGQALGVAVRADVTVTIGLPKLGLALEPGRSLAGEIHVARIGIADSLPGSPSRAEIWTRAGAGRRLPQRPRDGHKGTFGHLLLIAGSEGKTGAAVLAAAGAARAGAGLVTLACPAGLNDILEAKCTEAMTVPVAQTAERSFALAALDSIVALATERDLVGAGPGVGRGEETQALMRSLAQALACPLVLDADGLVAFSKSLDVLKGRTAPTILTPHPGEAALLLGRAADEINRDRVSAVRELADKTGSVVLLKGAASIAAHPDGRVVVNPTGGPALASGGTGDVLLGMVAAYVGQGLDPFAATAAAAFVHGATADSMAVADGSSGLIAGELAAAVPAVAEELRRTGHVAESGGAPGASSSSLTLPFPRA